MTYTACQSQTNRAYRRTYSTDTDWVQLSPDPIPHKFWRYSGRGKVFSQRRITSVWLA